VSEKVAALADWIEVNLPQVLAAGRSGGVLPDGG
jgi:hypothetical protein